MTPGDGATARAVGAPVLVEVVLLGHIGAQLTYRTRAADLIDGDHPDAVARSLAWPTLPPPGVGLLHSTSWRLSPSGVVLTYAALPDLAPESACRLRHDVAAPPSAGALAPSPEHIRREHVAAHACRQLSFLRRTDALVTTAADRLPDLWGLIDAYAPRHAVSASGGRV